MTHKLLIPAIRQYRHNNNDGLVFGYDVEVVDELVKDLDKHRKGLKHNLSVVETYLKEIKEEDCTEDVWYKIWNALEFAES